MTYSFSRFKFLKFGLENFWMYIESRLTALEGYFSGGGDRELQQKRTLEPRQQCGDWGRGVVIGGRGHGMINGNGKNTIKMNY